MFRSVDVPCQQTLHLDACLSSMGDIWSNRVFSCPALVIPGVKLHINDQYCPGLKIVGTVLGKCLVVQVDQTIRPKISF